MDRGAWRAAVYRIAEFDMTQQLSTQIHTHTHTDSKADFNPWENSWGFIFMLKRGH